MRRVFRPRWARPVAAPPPRGSRPRRPRGLCGPAGGSTPPGREPISGEPAFRSAVRVRIRSVVESVLVCPRNAGDRPHFRCPVSKRGLSPSPRAVLGRATTLFQSMALPPRPERTARRVDEADRRIGCFVCACTGEVSLLHPPQAAGRNLCTYYLSILLIEIAPVFWPWNPKNLSRIFEKNRGVEHPPWRGLSPFCEVRWKLPGTVPTFSESARKNGTVPFSQAVSKQKWDCPPLPAARPPVPENRRGLSPLRRPVSKRGPSPSPQPVIAYVLQPPPTVRPHLSPKKLSSCPYPLLNRSFSPRSNGRNRGSSCQIERAERWRRLGSATRAMWPAGTLWVPRRRPCCVTFRDGGTASRAWSAFGIIRRLFRPRWGRPIIANRWAYGWTDSYNACYARDRQWDIQ